MDDRFSAAIAKSRVESSGLCLLCGRWRFVEATKKHSIGFGDAVFESVQLSERAFQKIENRTLSEMFGEDGVPRVWVAKRPRYFSTGSYLLSVFSALGFFCLRGARLPIFLSGSMIGVSHPARSCGFTPKR